MTLLIQGAEALDTHRLAGLYQTSVRSTGAMFSAGSTPRPR